MDEPDVTVEEDEQKQEAPETHEEWLLAPERSVGSTERGQAANACLLAIARAARSFLLYDARNEAIKAFLVDYEKRLDLFTGSYGELDLEVRPFEFVLEGEVVYIERDRTRSLAYRLFRDGVRHLTIEPMVTWDESLRLLEVLSIRYTGVRQQEDDIVTLLWKAGFANIRIEAVEGVMLDEEEERAAEGGRRGSRQAGAAAHIEAPKDRDRPLPSLSEPTAVRYAPLTKGQLALLRAELDTQDLSFATLTLVQRMLLLVHDPIDPMGFDDVKHFIIELRDFLMAEEQLGSLSTLIDLIKAVEPVDPEGVKPILEGFADPTALRRILRSIAHTHTRPPDELLHVLDQVEGDHLDSMIRLIEVEQGPVQRRIARQLIERFIPGNEDRVIEELLNASDANVQQDLLRACAHAIPGRALDVGEALASSGHADVLRELLYFLQHIPSSAEASSTLQVLLDCPVEEVRLASIRELGQRPHTNVRMLIDHLTVRTNVPHREASEIGIAIARLNPTLGRLRFREWIRPAGFFKRLTATSGDLTLQFAGAAGLELIDGEEDDELLHWLASRAGSELAERCQKSLARRRQRRRGEERG
ncbi:MAG: hypothetical protein GY913_27020 [Proteobacteria bacterium]|nr:hypothetical protein [Pseudomonadota bacterium]